MIFHFLGCKIHRDLFFISHVLVWINVLCFFFFASTGWEQRVMFFFSREMPTQVPEINATCFFFEHGKWAEIHVYIFFILARLRRAKFPFSACISALARLRRTKFLNSRRSAGCPGDLSTMHLQGTQCLPSCEHCFGCPEIQGCRVDFVLSTDTLPPLRKALLGPSTGPAQTHPPSDLAAPEGVCR